MTEPGRFSLTDGAAVFEGTLDITAAAAMWRQVMQAAPRAIDARKITRLDSAGAVLLLEAARLHNATLTPPEDATAGGVLARMQKALAAAPPIAQAPQPDPVTRLGLAVIAGGQGLIRRIAFLGEVTQGVANTFWRPWRLRRVEVLRHLDEAGTRGFGLCMLLGALLGVILSFQSSIPMRKFGAEIFIPQLVGISLLRELGPLMAAIILAGRSASAYAAELGTMRVNEEVDALSTMGVDTVQWLVLPRILAAVLVMPVLALVVNITGLLGMALVMGSLGFPAALVLAQLREWVDPGDLIGGLVKAAMFGLAIGLIGCRAGLRAGGGPRAVGDAATSAVVGSIIAVVVMDGVLAVIFFRMGW